MNRAWAHRPGEGAANRAKTSTAATDGSTTPTSVDQHRRLREWGILAGTAAGFALENQVSRPNSVRAHAAACCSSIAVCRFDRFGMVVGSRCGHRLSLVSQEYHRDSQSGLPVPLQTLSGKPVLERRSRYPLSGGGAGRGSVFPMHWLCPALRRITFSKPLPTWRRHPGISYRRPVALSTSPISIS